MDNIEIRNAVKEDALSINRIIQYWVEIGNSDDKSKGYLRPTSIFNYEQLLYLIENNYVTVAATNSEICSFYLVNKYFHKELIAERNKLIKDKIKVGVLPNGNYAVSLLASSSINHLGKGLNTKTLNLLRENSKSEFDYFVGIMSYDNFATHKSSLKMGWKHFGDIGIGLLAVIGTTDERNTLLDEYASR